MQIAWWPAVGSRSISWAMYERSQAWQRTRASRGSSTSRAGSFGRFMANQDGFADIVASV